ncbi:MAG: hypothetical protein JWP92_1539 [Caulobacter sp.]|nr:hypothetical protein [Caulobacter sp.]
MTDSIEERLEDLERLVLKQAERIVDLELQVESLLRLARHAMQRGAPEKSEAA